MIAIAILRLHLSIWPYVQRVLWTLTLFFHMIPGLTETFTRLPAGSPVFSSPEDPTLQTCIGVVFILFAILMVFQVLHMRKQRGPDGIAAT